jgi:hypothetical protein
MACLALLDELTAAPSGRDDRVTQPTHGALVEVEDLGLVIGDSD